jgi:hypothetical protein
MLLCRPQPAGWLICGQLTVGSERGASHCLLRDCSFAAQHCVWMCASVARLRDSLPASSLSVSFIARARCGTVSDMVSVLLPVVAQGVLL